MRMNGLLLLSTIMILAFVLVGCDKSDTNKTTTVEETTTTNETTTEEETTTTTAIPDEIKPLIFIDSDEVNITIKQGEDYDLMKGISGLDNIEDDITDRIQMNLGDFNKDVPGTYVILYFLSDSSGNSANPISRTVTVIDSTVYAAPPVYLGEIQNEKPQPTVPACFQGAWYHKVVSSKDTWLGIEGTITLPKIKITRYENDSYNTELDIDPFAKNLDNPSIYMGGFASTESDVGLSLSKVCFGPNCSLTTGSVAFRPFWRYITNVNYDEGGYDVHDYKYSVSCRNSGSSGYKNCIANWHFSYTEYYYLPGDRIRMLIYSPKPNYLQMQIEVIEKSTLPESVKLRHDNGWKDPENFLGPIFSSPGHGTGGLVEYKRVNAIDQVNNEGKPIIYTDTIVDTATWHESYLYRKIDGEVKRIPMTSDRVGVMNCPIADRFTINHDNLDPKYGGENVQIHPGYSTTMMHNDSNIIFNKKDEDDI